VPVRYTQGILRLNPRFEKRSSLDRRKKNETLANNYDKQFSEV